MRGVAGEQLQRGLRQVGVDVGTVDVLGHVARSTEGRIPARGQFAVHFELEAAADGAACSAIGELVLAAQHRLTGGLADVVLFDAEHGQRGVQAVVEPRALDANFVALAIDRIEVAAIAVLQRLRLENFGVAGVGRVRPVDVEHQAGVWGGDLVRAVGAFTLALPVGVASADNQLQRIGQRQARGRVTGLLRDGALAGQGQRVPVRLTDLARPVQIAGERIPGLARATDLVVAVVGVLAPVVAEAGHQLVLAAEQLERAVNVAINAGDLALSVVEACGWRDARAGGPVEVRFARGPVVVGRVEQFVVGLGLIVRGANLELPAIAEGVLQGGEGALAGGVPVGPVRAGVERFVVAGARAIRIQHRETAPGRAVGALLLVVVAHAQLGVRSQVGVDDGIAQRLALVVAVHLAIGVQVAADYAAAHRATGVERAAYVHGGAGAAPAADVHRHAAGQLGTVGMLADQVHRRGRIAGTTEQAGGATHHFHAVVQRKVQAGITVAPVLHHLRGQAIELVGVDVEPTCVELGALAVGLGTGHAGGVGQHVDDVVQVLIFNALVADDAERLRDLARCQVEAGAGRGAAHRIAFGAFALDHHLVQCGRVGGGVGEGGRGRGQGAECNEYGNGQPLRLRDTEGGTGHGGPGRARALGRHPEGEALRGGTGGQAVLAPPET